MVPLGPSHPAISLGFSWIFHEKNHPAIADSSMTMEKNPSDGMVSQRFTAPGGPIGAPGTLVLPAVQGVFTAEAAISLCRSGPAMRQDPAGTYIL
jgi:hypothetical protein